MPWMLPCHPKALVRRPLWLLTFDCILFSSEKSHLQLHGLNTVENGQKSFSEAGLIVHKFTYLMSLIFLEGSTPPSRPFGSLPIN